MLNLEKNKQKSETDLLNHNVSKSLLDKPNSDIRSKIARGEINSFLPDLEHHVQNFVLKTNNLGNFDKVKKKGKIYFQGQVSEDYGNFLVAVNEFTRGKAKEAIKRCKYILKNDKNPKHAISLLLKIYSIVKDEEETIKLLSTAMKKYPKDATFKNLYGKSIIAVNGEKIKAISFLEDAVQLDPKNIGLWVDLGSLYFMVRNIPMAEICLKTALKIDQTNPQAIALAGIILVEHEKIDQAIELYTNSMKVYPSETTILRNLALYYLKKGDFKHGFQVWNSDKNEDRVGTKSVNNVTRRIPWLKKEDINNSKKLKILVYFEQGIGDYLQFARYLPYLKNRGHTVTAFGTRHVIDLLKESVDLKGLNFADEIKIIDTSKIKEYDAQTYIFNLPFLLDFENKIPPSYKINVKKIQNKNISLAKMISKLSDPNKKKIAFSYKGRRTHIYDLSRSIEIHTFSKLFQKPNCQFFLVDKDIGKDDEKFLKQFKNVVNCDSLINDWHDTVTILSKLDEIITVDTSLGHIGGVMNHPTRILVNKNCDWRWGMPEDGEKTPWYSSIKIIRQKESDNWEQLLMGLVNEKQK